MIMVYDGPGACNMFWDPLDPWTPLYTMFRLPMENFLDILFSKIFLQTMMRAWLQQSGVGMWTDGHSLHGYNRGKP